MLSLEEAVEEVLLGASLAAVRERFLMERLGVRQTDELRRALAGMDCAGEARVREEATRFAGQVCRYLGDRHRDDARMRHVLEEWAQRSKDYDAFDALFTNFDFPGRERLLAEARRLFPSPLTAHW